jgi:hypothetical protein
MIPAYSPMIPTLVPKPFHREGWVYEEKVDGYRRIPLPRFQEEHDGAVNQPPRR